MKARFKMPRRNYLYYILLNEHQKNLVLKYYKIKMLNELYHNWNTGLHRMLSRLGARRQQRRMNQSHSNDICLTQRKPSKTSYLAKKEAK
jgi:hypothetical protein